jgi:DNA-binding XRE family transcriptional regulator
MKEITYESLLARVEPKIERIPWSGCWIWMAGVNSNGYGSLYIGNSTKLVGRSLLEAMLGTKLGDLHARHTCDVTFCVNPHHLIPGTGKDNSQDAVSRGRKPRGENGPRAKLTNEQAREIRIACLSNDMSREELAKKYGISKQSVANIAIGRRYGKETEIVSR